MSGSPRIPYPEGPVDPRALNIERMFGHIAPDLLSRFGAFSAGVMATGSIDPQLRELAILRVGHLSDCAYELFQHGGFARAIGIAAEKLDAVAVGAASPLFDAREKALLAFVDELVRDVRPGDATLAAMRDHFDIAGIFTVLLVVCQYMTVCRILETTGVPIEEDASIGVARLRDAKAAAAATTET